MRKVRLLPMKNSIGTEVCGEEAVEVAREDAAEVAVEVEEWAVASWA